MLHPLPASRIPATLSQPVVGASQLRLAEYRTHHEDDAGRTEFPPLPRQPGGFEGLGLGEKAHKPSRLALLPLDHATEGRLGLGSACLATGVERTDRDEPIAQVTDLRQFQ